MKGGSNAALSFWSDVPPQAIGATLKARSKTFAKPKRDQPAECILGFDLLKKMARWTGIRAIGIGLPCMLGDPEHRIGGDSGAIGHVCYDRARILARLQMLNEDSKRMLEMLHAGHAHSQRSG